MTFNGLEQILMMVIKQTSHSDDHDDMKPRTAEEAQEVVEYKEITVTDAERLDNAMRALFGKIERKAYKRMPEGVSLSQMLEVIELEKDGKSRNEAIKLVVAKIPGSETILTVEGGEKSVSSLLYARIYTELDRNYSFYKNYNDGERDADLIDNPYYTEEQKKELICQRDKIFSALRDAGWTP